MFGLFKKDPARKLRKEYEALLLKARNIQRKGDIKAYAAVMAAAEETWKKIEMLEKSDKK
ncbi:MAG: Lacal_2735 family protein [Deltaproteobacteria bacterium]|nr:MAG: Lacal_2735 family protein [Deltaproteobacteria bacterium]